MARLTSEAGDHDRMAQSWRDAASRSLTGHLRAVRGTLRAHGHAADDRGSCQAEYVTGIEIEQVDERDSAWEVGLTERDVALPRYRVYLHSSPADETHGGTWAYDIVGAEVLQVIDWAQRQAGDRLTYAVALVLDDAKDGRGLVWLVGMDGNTATSDREEVAVLHRMLSRREHAVGIPPGDTMPTGVPDPFNDGTKQRPPI
ncbi:MAG: hypothetical protein JWO11_1354 [Nocardioides sp.]|nr:hypothetical protein [Nocardioides sp.]